MIVLLTDGRPDGGTEADALFAAGLARDLGATIYTIGLGSDVDAQLLKEIAGVDARYYQAPGEADLVAIYEAVARTIPCR